MTWWRPWWRMGPEGQLQKVTQGSRVEVVELHPGDVILLRMPGALSQAVADLLQARLEKDFPGHRCLVLADGLTLQVLREQDPGVAP
jgi:hypothetical protein